MIKKTSAVTTTVLGEVKIVGLLVLSAMLLGEGKEFTLKMTVGCGLAMSGFALYSHTKIIKFREGLQPRVISLSAAGGSAADMQPLKGDGGLLHRATSTPSSLTDKP